MHIAQTFIPPVITSFPDEKSSAVVFGLAMRIVMAANRFLSYVVLGMQSAIAFKSILPVPVST